MDEVVKVASQAVTDTQAHGHDSSLHLLVQAIFAMARSRKGAFAYAGAVTPHEAWTLHSAGAAQIVDIRTHAEWNYVGRVPDIPLVEWNLYPGGRPNDAFLQQLGDVVDRQRPVLFLCRSGVRSHSAAAAATEAGYPLAFNILEGFEGNMNGDHQRGRLGGWRVAGLPWVQS